ncbi:uncharacterized protein LOC123512380 [Portunus trituberculatus]|uniref:uncharacterized protein LOC123512380 n=1 Tax=Portunus trituberculatus TaxID=210409 RepID=UPI001E1D1AB6|nr:uncharacterized protein LOC123512380 [Portunus trituberculatus]
MRAKTAVCLLLVAAAACVSADEWSWGTEGEEEAPVSQGQATFSVSLSPEEEDEQEAPPSARSIGVDVLPLEPHGELTEEELRAFALAEEGGDREGRFLGISEKLCSYGIGINCNNRKHSGSVKSHYGPPPKHVAIPSNSYGAPFPKPPGSYSAPAPKPSGSYGAHPPLPYPNRKHQYTPTKAASFSPFKGIMSALEPYLPGSTKPKYPPKDNHGLLGSSYTAPNPTYAPLLPSYHPPTPKPAYVAPRPYVVPAKPVHLAQKVDYVAPKPAYVNPVHTYTVTVKDSVQPTIVEHHSHTHTHVYKGDAAAVTHHHDDPYYVQGSQQVFKRQESSVKSHGADNIQDLLSQDHQRHETRVRVTSSVSSSQGTHITQPQNFRPGKIEQGFKPMNTVPDTLFRSQADPIYREDCQCVSVSFCAAHDVVLPFTSDIRQFLDARNQKSDILSNATETDQGQEQPATEEPQQNAVRRGRVLGLSAERVYVSGANETATDTALEETVTEAVTEAATEQPLNEEMETETEEAVTETSLTEEESRVRRDVEAEEPVEEPVEDAPSPAPAAAIPRQGRQLTGFTPEGGGTCGFDHVCCRRPVFRSAAREEPHRYSCGRRNAKGLLGRVKNPSVVFSEGDTEFGEYPWQAAILKRKDRDMMYVCGAALIHSRYVLTAAHCVDGLNPADLKVRLGEWDVAAKSEFYKHLEMRVTGLYTHPDFYAGNLNNDLAVLRLESYVDFAHNPHITPICLPEEGAQYHHRCYATGWGKDGFGTEGEFSHVLKEVEVPMVSSEECTQRLRQTRLGSQFNLHEGNLCAGGEPGRDTCEGDGGGPLVCAGPEGAMELAGLVSWGIGCGHPGVPGVYVRVSHYLAWIRAITSA